MGKHADKWIFKSWMSGGEGGQCSARVCPLSGFGAAAERRYRVFVKKHERRNHVVKQTLIGCESVFFFFLQTVLP